MQVTMLGTSSGTPTRSRNVSAAAVNLEGKRDWVLVDCGEGTQHRLLRAPLSLLKLKAICITHMHGDHYDAEVGTRTYWSKSSCCSSCVRG